MIGVLHAAIMFHEPKIIRPTKSRDDRTATACVHGFEKGKTGTGDEKKKSESLLYKSTKVVIRGYYYFFSLPLLSSMKWRPACKRSLRFDYSQREREKKRKISF